MSTQMSVTDWQQKLAKEDKAVLIQYKNETKETWKFDFFDIENGKVLDKEKKATKDHHIEVKAGEIFLFPIKLASSHKKEKKHTKVTHRWVLSGGGLFTFSLFVWKEDTGTVTGKASHTMEPPLYEVRKKASWKLKPPLVTVRVYPPEAATGAEAKAEDSKKKTNDKGKQKEGSDKREVQPTQPTQPTQSTQPVQQIPQYPPAAAAPAAPQPLAAIPPGTEQIHAQAGSMVTQGIQQFEAGQFSEAQNSFIQSVACLVNFSSQSYHMFQAEMTFAIRYAQVQAALSSRLNYQASQFLLELQRLHSLQLFKQMALISSFLAELPLQMEHAIINLRIGISLNFQVGNFGTVARLIQVLASLVVTSGVTLPEQTLLEDLLEQCNAHECKDTCVPLGGNIDRVLCLSTLRLVQGNTYKFCPYCSATYRPNLRSVCVYCNTILQDGQTNTQ